MYQQDLAGSDGFSSIKEARSGPHVRTCHIGKPCWTSGRRQRGHRESPSYGSPHMSKRLSGSRFGIGLLRAAVWDLKMGGFRQKA